MFKPYKTWNDPQQFLSSSSTILLGLWLCHWGWLISFSKNFPWSLIHCLSPELWFTIHALGKFKVGQGSKHRDSNIILALYGSKCTLKFQLSESSALHLFRLNEYSYDLSVSINKLFKTCNVKGYPRVFHCGDGMVLYWIVVVVAWTYICNIILHIKKAHVKADKIWIGPVV